MCRVEPLARRDGGYNRVMLAALIALSVLVAALLIACGWLIARDRAAAVERLRLDASAAQLTAELNAARALADKLRQENADLLRQRDLIQQDLDNATANFDRALKQAREAFDATAARALQQATEQFLKLASANFEGRQIEASKQLEARQQAIDALLKPIREALDRHAAATAEVEKQREGAYHGLRQLVGTLVEDQKQLRSETANLVKALRRPDVRGRWGELQLRRVAELAGMIDRCDFTEQHSTRDGEGRRSRPDMVVHLPAGRDIVVDCKTPIDAYLAAIEAPSDEQREQELARFVRHVEDKIADLGSKSYQSQFDRSPDFVVMFIPGESFLQAALSRKPELLDSAFNRGVVLATPSTLIALLKAVAVGWREEQLAENAKKICDLGVELHSRLATLTKHLENLGNAVGKTVEHFNKFVGSYESQVMTQARRFKELGADSPKELPAEGALPLIESAPRPVKEFA